MLGYKHTQPCLTCYGDSEDSTVGPSACKASISYPVSWATDLSEHLHACIALYIVLQSPQPGLWPTVLYSYNLMLSLASRHQNSKLNLPSINYLSQTSSYLTIQFLAIVTSILTQYSEAISSSPVHFPPDSVRCCRSTFSFMILHRFWVLFVCLFYFVLFLFWICDIK